ncbi:MAG: NAD(P)H-dependent oxidoreductase [Flavobacteriales bacterium]
MKIVAYGASYSKESINRKFATFAASMFENGDVEVLDLNDYPLPLFTVDLEKEIGHPKEAIAFTEKLAEADLLVISMSEHNGNHTAAYKNLFDWVSRYSPKAFLNKKIFLISTSPGGRGGKSSLEIAKERLPRHGGEVIATFSLPNFESNFSVEKGIIDEDLKTQFMEAVSLVKAQI